MQIEGEEGCIQATMKRRLIEKTKKCQDLEHALEICKERLVAEKKEVEKCVADKNWHQTFCPFAVEKVKALEGDSHCMKLKVQDIGFQLRIAEAKNAKLVLELNTQNKEIQTLEKKLRTGRQEAQIRDQDSLSVRQAVQARDQDLQNVGQEAQVPDRDSLNVRQEVQTRDQDLQNVGQKAQVPDKDSLNVHQKVRARDQDFCGQGARGRRGDLRVPTRGLGKEGPCPSLSGDTKEEEDDGIVVKAKGVRIYDKSYIGVMDGIGCNSTKLSSESLVMELHDLKKWYFPEYAIHHHTTSNTTKRLKPRSDGTRLRHEPDLLAIVRERMQQGNDVATLIYLRLAGAYAVQQGNGTHIPPWQEVPVVSTDFTHLE
jgi:hypothetical protein